MGGTTARSSARSYIEKDLFELHDDWVPPQYARWGFTWWRAQTLRYATAAPTRPVPSRPHALTRRRCAGGRKARRRSSVVSPALLPSRALDRHALDRLMPPGRFRPPEHSGAAAALAAAALGGRSPMRRFVMRPKPFMRQHIEMVKARIGWAAPMVRGPALCFAL